MYNNLGNNVVAEQKNSDAGPSPSIWGREPLRLDPNAGIDIFDDFLNFGGLLTSNTGQYASQAGYTSYQDASNLITQLATERTGVVRIETDATDNDESWLQPGGATSVEGVISTTAGANLKFLWEARVRLTQVASGNLFVGFTEEGTAAADFINDAGTATADKDILGFLQLEAAPTVLMVYYKKAGQTAQTLIASAKVLAADTWYKLGIVYDPAQPASKQVRFFVDGVELTTYITATQLAADTFPNGEELNELFGVKNSTTVAKKLDIDWRRFRQYRA